MRFNQRLDDFHSAAEVQMYKLVAAIFPQQATVPDSIFSAEQ